MMMGNNSMMNQIDQSQILQTLQKNNEQIIQMIQQIFQIQMMNNILINKILSNNLNNINNDMLNNNMMNQMNNFINNMNMINNQNIQMNNNNNFDNIFDGHTGRKINIIFQSYDTRKIILIVVAPENISIKESIEEFWKKSGIYDPDEQKNFIFKRGGDSLKIDDTSLLDKYKENQIYILVYRFKKNIPI